MICYLPDQIRRHISPLPPPSVPRPLQKMLLGRKKRNSRDREPSLTRQLVQSSKTFIYIKLLFSTGNRFKLHSKERVFLWDSFLKRVSDKVSKARKRWDVIVAWFEGTIFFIKRQLRYIQKSLYRHWQNSSRLIRYFDISNTKLSFLILIYCAVKIIIELIYRFLNSSDSYMLMTI